jgi:tetratricopeptide (TPR) repeat protein
MTGRGNPPALSLCMIVKDEEKCLDQCLSSVAPILEEIVVVDTGSRDRTREIALGRGAKVIEIEWGEDFSEARNVSLAHAAGEWVLVLDADEIIAKKDLRNLQETCLSGGFNAYTLITRNYTADDSGSNWVPNDGTYDEAAGLPGWFPSGKARLFRRHEKIRFEGVVHELVDPSIKRLGWPIGPCEVPVHHFGKMEAGRLGKKGNAYLDLADRKLQEDRQNPKAYFERGVQNAELGLHEKAVEDFFRVKRLARAFPQIDAYLGASLVHLGRCDHAIEILKQGLTREPGNAGLWNNLGLAHYCMGDYDHAIVNIEKAVHRNPDYAAAWKNLGMAYTQKGRIEEARGAFERSLRLNPAAVELKGVLVELEKLRG